MKKIANTIFVALLISGASSVNAQDVKKENTSTKIAKTDINKIEVVKEADATLINPDGTVKEVKTVQVNDKSIPKTKKSEKTTVKKEKADGVVIEKIEAVDGVIKKD
jgi:hypothetical protein